MLSRWYTSSTDILGVEMRSRALNRKLQASHVALILVTSTSGNFDQKYRRLLMISVRYIAQCLPDGTNTSPLTSVQDWAEIALRLVMLPYRESSSDEVEHD